MQIQSSFERPQPLTQELQSSRVGAAPVETAAAQTPGSPGVVDGDETHLSSTSILAAASSTLPEVRTEKVADIQQALAAGSYTVSPAEVAGKLIDHLLQR